MAHNFKNWLGQRSGRLLITEHLGKEVGGKQHMWFAVCDCGNTKTVKSRELNAGDVKSCGCLKLERVKELNKTHGWSGTPEYLAWKRVKRRVYNKNDKDYPVYSLLGMEDCWKNNFLEFLAEMGEMPKDGQRWSVGRIDNTVGYMRGNVRWEIDSQQAKNKGKYKNNSTGETGVYWNRVISKKAKTDTTYAVATWYDKEGNQRSRSYSVSCYGIMEAFALAVKKRREMLEELRKQGVVYGEHHGK